MAPATSICMLLATACLLCWRGGDSPLVRQVYAGLAGAGLFLTGLSLLGHLFDSTALYAVLFFEAMALTTSLGFLLLFPALLLARSDWGFTRIYTGSSLGSAMLRRTLPIAVLGPVVLCWITLLAVEAGFFEVNFRLTVLTAVMTIMLVTLFTWSAVRENASADHIVKTNERLRQALSDRDILLKEVYHRVKNNLQFVDAMLALESNELAGNATAERLPADRLADVRARLHAMALVHQQLIASRDLASLNLETFLKELCGNMAKGAGVDSRGITLTIDAAPISVHLDRAVPIGLMVTELIANAVKYAFPEGQGGEILVLAQDLGERGLTISVSDNGVGRDPAVAGGTSVGSMILRSLASQLDGEMTERDIDGHHVELLIPRERT
jgi:two-component sensor histidine kinase